MTWVNMPRRHGWAFFYFLKRRGERVKARPERDGTVSVLLET